MWKAEDKYGRHLMKARGKSSWSLSTLFLVLPRAVARHHQGNSEASYATMADPSTIYSGGPQHVLLLGRSVQQQPTLWWYHTYYGAALLMQQHWNTIYRTKDTAQVSWYQEYPKTSLDLITATAVEKSRPILDVGGGDSRLVDVLLASGYTQLSVLDIAPLALRKAQTRLGAQARQVRWIVADVLHLPDDLQVDIWHDRATFHFLRVQEDITRYAGHAARHIKPHGSLVLDTFSVRGPHTCSGLPVARYSEETIKEVFHAYFEHIASFEEEHITPFRTAQFFLWTMLKKT